MHGQETVNVMHFATNIVINDNPGPNPLLLQLAQALLDCAITTLLPGVTSDWRLVKTSATIVAASTGDFSDTVDATAPAASIGAKGAASVSFMASLVDLKTGKGKKRGRGRIFLPPPGEPEIALSEIDPATLVLITNFCLCMAGKFLGASPTTDWRFGVYSRTDSGGSFGNFNTAFREIVQMSPRGTLAVIGRRKKGRGD
jgi:hypothetical protein